jgi:hypothetical protein
MLPTVRVVSNNTGVGAVKMPTVARFAATHCVTYNLAKHSQHQSLNPNTYTIFNQTQENPQKGIYQNLRKNMLLFISCT